MPAVFGAWSQPGGKRSPSVFEDSQVLKFSRKYKHGKRVGRREVVEKFKALAILDGERAFSRVGPCANCSWSDSYYDSHGDEDWDEEASDSEFWDHWDDDCILPCRYDGYNYRNVKGVYTINRQALAIRARIDGHGHKHCDSHLRPHPSSKVKRSEAKKDARDALRDFEDRK